MVINFPNHHLLITIYQLSRRTTLESYNIGQTLADTAAQRPFQTAIVFPVGRDEQGRAITAQVTFQQLNALCDQYAHGLTAYGITSGERVLLLLRPNIDFLAVIFALLKMGAVPICHPKLQ
jgi:acyl-CoA synthetase (AMP-forming)/AMP-acid ligase II